MYTRCPHCNTIFEVTAGQLRMAQGDIDCVTCRKTFDAVESLADEVTMLIGAVDLETRDTWADTSGDLAREMSGDITRDLDEDTDDDREFFAALGEDSIDEETVWPALEEESAAGQQDDEARATAEAADEAGDEDQHDPADDDARASDEAWPGGDDTGDDFADAPAEVDSGADEFGQAVDSMEFDAPEQTWTKYFLTDEENVSPDRKEPWIGPQNPEALDDETQDPGEWAAFLDELNVGDAAQEQPARAEPAASADRADDDEEISLIAPWLVGETDTEPAAEPPAKTRRWSLVTVIAGLALMLAAQLIHYNRDSLAASPTYGPMIRQAYTALDIPLYPEWPLEVFEVTGTEAVAGRSSPETLDVLANVVVGGRDRVGLPLVRIVLRDRWSAPIASRVFAPAEYLDNYDPAKPLVQPGSAFAVDISVADPGAEALGYVVDICLPRRKLGLECQIAKDPFQ